MSYSFPLPDDLDTLSSSSELSLSEDRSSRNVSRGISPRSRSPSPSTSPVRDIQSSYRSASLPVNHHIVQLSPRQDSDPVLISGPNKTVNLPVEKKLHKRKRKYNVIMEIQLKQGNLSELYNLNRKIMLHSPFRK